MPKPPFLHSGFKHDDPIVVLDCLDASNLVVLYMNHVSTILVVNNMLSKNFMH